MTILLLLGAAVIFFVLGIVYLIRGFKGNQNKEKGKKEKKETEEIVPITDINEIKEINGTKEADPIRVEEVSIDTGVVDEVEEHDSLPGVPADITSSDTEIKISQDEIEKLREENKRLNEALNRELSVKDKKTLSEEEKKMLEEKDEEIANLNHAIEGYMLEIRSLRNKHDEYRQHVVSDRDLDIEISTVTQEKEELNALIEKLRKDINIKDDEIISQRSDNEKEKQGLLSNISELENKISENKEVINTLYSQINILKDSQFESNSQEVSAKLMDAEEIKLKNQQLSKELYDLSGKIKDFSEQNTYLLKKEGVLQNELTKTRAQALGLERICEDFKIKLEQGAK